MKGFRPRSKPEAQADLWRDILLIHITAMELQPVLDSHNALLIGMGCAVAVTLLCLMLCLTFRRTVELTGAWGGFGGGQSGWSMSPALVLFVVTLFFGAGFVAVAGYNWYSIFKIIEEKSKNDKDKSNCDGGQNVRVQVGDTKAGKR